jgi:hypothetical protein
MTHRSDTIILSAITMCNCCKIEIAEILKVFCFFVIILLYLSVICLIQLNFDNSQVFAQEVPLIPIQSGNATLDQGLPVFYDCLDNVVDESFSEQEDNYFKHEPRKSEVVECYHKVFVNNINNNGRRKSGRERGRGRTIWLKFTSKKYNCNLLQLTLLELW